MRRKLIAGNWKMNTVRGAAVTLAREIVKGVSNNRDNLDIALCPPYVYLDAVHHELRGTTVALGAQDLFSERHGAFTGEVSAEMLLDLGCKYVIVGHSERRHILKESDDIVHRKVRLAMESELHGHRLIPIVCVGELLSERESGQTAAVIRRQFEDSLESLSAEQVAHLVIAYEPVWAIGTGKVASPQQVQEVHSDLRNLLA